MIELNFLHEQVALGNVVCRRHPTLPLSVFKYSKTFEIDARNAGDNSAYRSYWTPEMRAIRGIVIADDGEIVSRPFGKFFNVEDEDYQVPPGKFSIYEKLDGSAIVVSWWNGQLIVNTLGSFDSDQAQKAKELLYGQYSDQLYTLENGKTYIFEAVYPENQIVVKYSDYRLVLLAIIDNRTGKDLPIDQHEWKDKPKIYHFATIKEVVSILNRAEYRNEEGFVGFWLNEGYRIKFKYKEYFRLHKIRSNLQPSYIWEILKDGKSPLVDLGDLPDEFILEIETLVERFQQNYSKIENRALDIFNQSPQNNRKEFALFVIQKCKEYDIPSGILFAMLDKKSYATIIWRFLEPKQKKELDDSAVE